MKDFSNSAFKKVSKKPAYDCFSLLGELFASRNIAHLAHLNTTSFAEHKALNEYYDSILDLTDELAETYIGIYGRNPISIPASNLTDIGGHLKELRLKVVEHREYVLETNIQNILDEILSLIDKTNYLITLK